MTFESSKSKGSIGTILIVLLPIFSIIIYVPLNALRLSSDSIIYLSPIFAIPSYVGFTLFLAAMHGMSRVYKAPEIFKNSLYGFTASVAGAIASTLAAFVFFVPLLDQLTTQATSPGTLLPISAIVSFLKVMVFFWIGTSILAAVDGFFYRRAFYALSEKSGEGNFRTAGWLMILGGALTIVIVGGIIFIIGWIIAAMGFSAMKPKPEQANTSLT
jgi:uncharacterized membrane protein